MYFQGKGWHSDVVVPPRFECQFDDLKLNPNQICFLYCYIATCGHIANAAQAARVNRVTHNWWLNSAENKDDYREAFERVKPIATQALLDKAIERAANGVEEPVFFKGAVVGFIQKYSDTLMVTLLKGLIPDTFKERVDTTLSNKPGEVFKYDPGRSVLTEQKLKALLDLGQKAIDAKTAAIVAANKLKPENSK